VNGFVCNAASLQAVQGATVIPWEPAEETASNTTTDADGSFILEEVVVEKFMKPESGQDPVMSAFDIVKMGYDTLRVEWVTRGSFSRDNRSVDTFRLAKKR